MFASARLNPVCRRRAHTRGIIDLSGAEAASCDAPACSTRSNMAARCARRVLLHSPFALPSRACHQARPSSLRYGAVPRPVYGLATPSHHPLFYVRKAETLRKKEAGCRQKLPEVFFSLHFRFFCITVPAFCSISGPPQNGEKP